MPASIVCQLSDAKSRCRGGGRRDGGRLVRVLPAPGRAGPGRPDREGLPRPGREQPGGRRGPDAGRDARGGAPGPVVPPVLPEPAGRDRHRLGVHRAGLPAALLHRGGRRGGARADGDAVRAGRPGALARSRRGGRGQPDAGAGADARRHVLRPGRVHHAAAQRGRLHGGADPQRRRGARARRVPRRWRPGRRGRDQPGADRRGAGGADRRAEARRGRPRWRACASRPAGPGTRSR